MTKEQVLSELDSIANRCASPDWGGEDEDPVHPDTVKTAKGFVSIRVERGIEIDYVKADNDGMISFEFDCEDKFFFDVAVDRWVAGKYAYHYATSLKVTGTEIYGATNSGRKLANLFNLYKLATNNSQ